MNAKSAAQPGLNLLALRPVRALVLWPGFPYAFQAVALIAFVALAVIGWGHFTPQGVNAKLYAKANLVNLLIWGLWWPAVVWVTVLFGRAWCTVCPMELVANFSERLGRIMGLRQQRLGGWFAKGSLILCLFALLQMLVPGIQIHRVPAYTSIFLWVMLAAAFVTGLFLKDRAFCRGFCPVALLLNAYGRGGMLAVRPGSCKACPSCDEPVCRTEADRAKADARSCPSLLNPPNLDSNQECLVCGQCVKACPKANMQFVLRAPFSRADARESLASWPLTLCVMIVSGFVIYELTGVWKAAEPLFLWVPKQVSAALSVGTAAGWIQGLWTIAVVPLLLWLALGGVTLVLQGAKSMGEAWRRLALPMAVVVAAGHMAKSLEKFTSWAGFLPYAWMEPTGVQTAIKMNAKAMEQPAAWLSARTLSLLAMLIVGSAIVLSIREARLTDPQRYPRRLAPLLLLGGFFFFLVFGWGGWTS